MASLPRVRHGVTFDSSLRPDQKAIRRFWSNVVRGPGASCWLWVGPISTPDGYGRFRGKWADTVARCPLTVSP